MGEVAAGAAVRIRGTPYPPKPAQVPNHLAFFTKLILPQVRNLREDGSVPSRSFLIPKPNGNLDFAPVMP